MEIVVSGMRLRAAALAVAALAVAVPMGAMASTPAARHGHSCTVLTDRRGDAGISTVTPGGTPSDPGLDIRAVVLSGDRNLLQVALLMDDLSAGVQVGRMWSVSLGSSQSPQGYYSVVATEQADSDGFAIYGPGNAQNKPPLANVTGRIDASTNTVNISVPLKLLLGRVASQGVV
jgi:hypothetical protein